MKFKMHLIVDETAQSLFHYFGKGQKFYKVEYINFEGESVTEFRYIDIDYRFVVMYNFQKEMEIALAIDQMKAEIDRYNCDKIGILYIGRTYHISRL